MHWSRRELLARGAVLCAGFAGLRQLAAAPRAPRPASDFGPLLRDPSNLLDLPEGFACSVISRGGDLMDDGFLVPGAPDGMAAFAGGADGKVVLIRNHELTAGVGGGAFGAQNELLSKLDPALAYDLGHGRTPCRGGTTTLVYDVREKRLERQFLSLAGTARNCAGGPTPWGSWISCEEAVDRQSEVHEREHGFPFEVPISASGPVAPVPLTSMGRFNHEAAAADPESGAVYMSEDRGDGLFYRYLPDERGRLERGGRLQALAIRGAASVDTRNWNRFARFPVGEPVEVEWIDLEGIDAPSDDLRQRGFLAGAARFARGEGLWAARGALFFCCTVGGPNRAGQVFRYIPSPHEGERRERLRHATLELFLEPNHRRLVDMCDNLTVAPFGDLVLCEDGLGGNSLVGVTPRGDIYPLARNAKSFSEFAGATFSPDGSTLFVNVQADGLTLAITGPWPAARDGG